MAKEGVPSQRATAVQEKELETYINHGRNEMHKKSPSEKQRGFKRIPGGVLLSHTVTRAVPSALKSLTSVFGMGTGVSSSPLPPENFMIHQIQGKRSER